MAGFVNTILVVLTIFIAISTSMIGQQPVGYALPVGPHKQSAISMLRAPMPWEDGYFDPSYHAWSKGKEEQTVSKKAN